MATDYVASRRAAAFLPARDIKRYLDAGQLFLVPDAPVFPYPVWSIWREDLDTEIRKTAEATLVTIQSQIDEDQSAVIADLVEISAGKTVEVLGLSDERK